MSTMATGDEIPFETLQDMVFMGPDALTSTEEILGMTRKIMWPQFLTERERLHRIGMWFKGYQERPILPRAATRELTQLLELSRTPWLGLAVTTVAQALFVDGYTSPQNATDTRGAWQTWLANGMPSKQTALYKAALGYGYSYAFGLPGVGPSGSNQAVVRCRSPLDSYAVYEDKANDEWPRYGMEVTWAPNTGLGYPEKTQAIVYLYDDTFKHKMLLLGADGARFEYVSSVPHGAGVCPVVRYANELDLEGNAPGEVEPFIPVAMRIDKTVFDRLLTQHFASWRVRYITGMSEFADDDAVQNLESTYRKLQGLKQADILAIPDSEAKVGTLDASDVVQFITANQSDIETLSALAQVPSHILTGQVVNLAADAIAAARAPLTQKIAQRQVSFGTSHAQLMRLVAHLEGDEAAAQDYEAAVSWQDMDVRSLAQAADALGKLALSLGIPKQALWAMVPNVTQTQIEEWGEMILNGDKLTALLNTEVSSDLAVMTEENKMGSGGQV
ncbi:phage portal protein [Tsukamurella soli]|uniref:Phage portal protein n=1 Tax=Tsukamurella soli TaxID=644556 RepID=A0ABP8JJM8_9ACTN